MRAIADHELCSEQALVAAGLRAIGPTKRCPRQVRPALVNRRKNLFVISAGPALGRHLTFEPLVCKDRGVSEGHLRIRWTSRRALSLPELLQLFGKSGLAD